jgi:hypothetical protein
MDCICSGSFHSISTLYLPTDATEHINELLISAFIAERKVIAAGVIANAS